MSAYLQRYVFVHYLVKNDRPLWFFLMDIRVNICILFFFHWNWFSEKKFGGTNMTYCGLSLIQELKFLWNDEEKICYLF